MTFPRANPIGWALFEELTSAQMNTLDVNLSRAVDGYAGGTYAPSSPIVIQGDGMNIHPCVVGDLTALNRAEFLFGFSSHGPSDVFGVFNIYAPGGVGVQWLTVGNSSIVARLPAVFNEGLNLIGKLSARQDILGNPLLFEVDGTAAIPTISGFVPVTLSNSLTVAGTSTFNGNVVGQGAVWSGISTFDAAVHFLSPSTFSHYGTFVVDDTTTHLLFHPFSSVAPTYLGGRSWRVANSPAMYFQRALPGGTRTVDSVQVELLYDIGTSTLASAPHMIVTIFGENGAVVFSSGLTASYVVGLHTFTFPVNYTVPTYGPITIEVAVYAATATSGLGGGPVNTDFTNPRVNVKHRQINGK